MNLLDKVFLKMTLTSMLNPLNQELFIKNLTLDKVKVILSEQPDDSFTDIFWTAYNIATALYVRGTQVTA